MLRKRQINVQVLRRVVGLMMAIALVQVYHVYELVARWINYWRRCPQRSFLTVLPPTGTKLSSMIMVAIQGFGLLRAYTRSDVKARRHIQRDRLNSGKGEREGLASESQHLYCRDDHTCCHPSLAAVIYCMSFAWTGCSSDACLTYLWNLTQHLSVFLRLAEKSTYLWIRHEQNALSQQCITVENKKQGGSCPPLTPDYGYFLVECNDILVDNHDCQCKRYQQCTNQSDHPRTHRFWHKGPFYCISFSSRY